MIRNTRMRYRVQRCRCAQRERERERALASSSENRSETIWEKAGRHQIHTCARVLVRARVPINERLLVSQVKVIRLRGDRFIAADVYRATALSKYQQLATTISLV